MIATSLAVCRAILCGWNAFAQDPPDHSQEGELQRIIDEAAPHSVVKCDENKELVFSAPVVIRKPLVLAGLHARLPEKLGNTALVIVEAKGVAVTDFELVGNAESVSQKERAPLLIVHAGEFRVERGRFLNSSKDGVMIDGDGPAGEDVIGGVVRDLVGRGVRRDVVSISGSSGHGRKVRNVLVDNIRCYESAFRGAVEVSDGTDNITVRKVYAENAIYAIDVQDHHEDGQANINVVIEDVYARNCRHIVRTANSRRGHANLTLRDLVGDACELPVQLSHTNNVSVNNVRILNPHGSKPPMQIDDCRGVSVRDIVIENISGDTGVLLIQNCDETLVDGLVLRGEIGKLSNAVCYRIRGNGIFSGLRIRNVSARNLTDAGIVLEQHDAREGGLTDYVISGNAATVRDAVMGARRVVSDNLIEDARR